MRIAPLLLALLAASCAVDRSAVSAVSHDALPEFDRASADSDRASAEVARLEQAALAAAETPDPTDDQAAAEALAAANLDLQQAEYALAKIEDEVARKQASPLASLLPYGIAPLALEAVVALSSRRKRKLYSSAFRNLSRGQLLTSAGDVLKALGAQHSTPPPDSGPAAVNHVQPNADLGSATLRI